MRAVERYRAEIVVLVVLPISQLIWLAKRVRRICTAPDPLAHGIRVERVAADVRASHAQERPLRTDRSVFNSHSVRNADKSTSHKVKLSDLSAILSLDGEANIIHVEPGVTVGEVTDFLLGRDMQLECCLEMEDATLGGLAMAQGMTTHSHVCGLLSETVVEYEVVIADGTVVVATAANTHADLFRALPLSHGTLGFLVSLKLRVVAAKSWVELRYTPCRSQKELHQRYTAILESARLVDEGQEPPFFVEAIAFDQESAVLMEGNLTDEARVVNDKINRVGWWFKPWFFEHVRTMLDSGGGSGSGDPPAATVEYIPLREYLMRHDRSMCMTMATIIPYGNRAWFRWSLGWLLPPQMSFLKSSHTTETREASIRKQCYQDVAFPAEELCQVIHA